MRRTEITETRRYKLFDVGERVIPTSRRSGLDEGVYVVTRCTPPLYFEDHATVFLEGHTHGFDTYYLTSVDDPEEDWVREKAERLMGAKEEQTE